MLFDPRKPTRLDYYDYSLPGGYFFTACTSGFRQIFARLRNDEFRLSRFGRVVWETWQGLPEHFPRVELDEFVVMPNHIHGILILHPVKSGEKLSSLIHVLASLKSFSSQRINVLRGTNQPAIWQRSYRDRVIRPEEDLNDYRQYIRDNPRKWELDEYNQMSRQGRSKTGPYNAAPAINK